MSTRKNNAQQLLQGKRIVGVNDDNSNQLILMLEDGTTVVVEAGQQYVGNGLTLATIRVRAS